MNAHRVVSRDEWLVARKELLKKEKELTRFRDQVSALRRELPWVRIEKPYVFEGPNGKRTLADIFQGRSQLLVYHFMLAPDSDHLCDGCSFFADHVDAARQHFEHNDLSFAAISRARVPQIEAVKKRMGWRFQWVSSYGTSFNYDFGASFPPEEIAKGDVGYNYGTSPYVGEDLHGISVFYLENGEVFHTYSTYARGGDLLIGAYNFLDLTPKGRNEKTIMDWVRCTMSTTGTRIRGTAMRTRAADEPTIIKSCEKCRSGGFSFDLLATHGPGAWQKPLRFLLGNAHGVETAG